MNKILLVASGGLANRMRAIASVIALAEERHCTPTIVWTCNSDLNAPLSDIFLTKPFSDVQVIAPSAIDAILKYEIPRKKNLYRASTSDAISMYVSTKESIFHLIPMKTITSSITKSTPPSEYSSSPVRLSAIIPTNYIKVFSDFRPS